MLSTRLDLVGHIPIRHISGQTTQIHSKQILDIAVSGACVCAMRPGPISNGDSFPDASVHASHPRRFHGQSRLMLEMRVYRPRPCSFEEVAIAQRPVNVVIVITIAVFLTGMLAGGLIGWPLHRPVQAE